tara:strand:+ start:71 stop:265 length:195 start_codon:yes stop_codon:yes gene_type:complete
MTVKNKIKLSVIMDKLADLGWDYTAGRMSRSGMQIFDELMWYTGALEPNEHWNEDCYNDKNGDW